MKDIGRRLPLDLACPRANRVVLVRLCAEPIQPVFECDLI